MIKDIKNNLPIISLSELAKNNRTNHEVSKLQNICHNFGFFYLKQHGISQSLIDKTMNASRGFFRIPQATKDKYGSDKQKVGYYHANGGFAGKHTDDDFLSVIIQENNANSSLKVYSKTQKEWISLPCFENMFVVLVGDMLRDWTNGSFVSAPHQVKNDFSSSRMSIIFFLYPRLDTIIKSNSAGNKIRFSCQT